jgi:Fe2+ or Zn2+ uptake regulation protein
MEISWERELRATGGRMTPQRRVITNILQEQKGHLSADEIYLLAQQQHSGLSLATVYRTLQRLKESGLVRELRLNSGRCHYEIERDKAHQHMVCLDCGKVIEFTCAHFFESLNELADQHGFQITSTRVKLLGYCADCQARTHNET